MLTRDRGEDDSDQFIAACCSMDIEYVPEDTISDCEDYLQDQAVGM